MHRQHQKLTEHEHRKETTNAPFSLVALVCMLAISTSKPKSKPTSPLHTIPKLQFGLKKSTSPRAPSSFSQPLRRLSPDVLKRRRASANAVSNKNHDRRKDTYPGEICKEGNDENNGKDMSLIHGRAVKKREVLSAGLAFLSTCASPALPILSSQAAGSAPTNAFPSPDWKPTVGMELPRRRFQKEEEFFNLRFVTYFTRFLLNFDQDSRKYWDDAAASIPFSYTVEQVREARLKQYGQFAASVEFGMKPFNSREGIDRLLQILKEKFTSPSAKRQIAILFSFLTSRQPIEDIEQLIAEADNATVSSVSIVKQGSGYLRPPKVVISPPIASSGTPATAQAKMRALGPIGAINITDGGSGYESPPEVVISGPSSSGDEGGARQAIAKARIDQGRVVAIDIIDHGDGYSYERPLAVKLVGGLRPSVNGNDGVEIREASAKAVLELGVDKIMVVNGGFGYGNRQVVKVYVAPPQDSFGLLVGETATANATLKKRPFKSDAPRQLPSSSISQQLTQLIPDSTIPLLDPDSGLYRVAVPFDEVSSAWLLDKESRCGGALDPVFGPRGCIPVEREIRLSPSTYAKFAISGALCAAVSHAVLTPLEVVKTKAQTEPDRRITELIGETFAEGPGALFRGIGPTATGFFIGGSMSFGLTELFRRIFAEMAGPQNVVLFEIPILISASIVAVIFACIGVVPFEAVRIKLQSDEDFADGLVGGFKRLAKESGLRGFYEGLGAILFKEIPFALCKFAVFDAACASIYDLYPAARESLSTALFVSVLGGAVSGAVAAVVSHPADTVLTSLYSEDPQGEEEIDRTDISGAVMRITEQRGWPALFAGLVPRMIFAALLLALEFLLYDYLKIVLGVSQEDLSQYLDVLGSFR